MSRVGPPTNGVATPLLREGVPIGHETSAADRGAAFHRQGDRTLETFAAQAVIAIENTRLFEEVEARTAELSRSVASEGARAGRPAVTSTLDLQTVLDTMGSARPARGRRPRHDP